MLQSEKIDLISTSLVAAQRVIDAVVKDTTNPYYKSKYADLSSIISAVKDPLNENGIVLVQSVYGGDLETMLIHTSGQYIGSKSPIVCAKPNDPQAWGSALSYARRYSLSALLSVPTEDDDAESAMKRTPQQQSQPQQPKLQAPRIPAPSYTSAFKSDATQPQKNAVLGILRDMSEEKKKLVGVTVEMVSTFTYAQASEFIKKYGRPASYSEVTSDLPATDNMRRHFFAKAHELNLNTEEEKEKVKAKFGVSSFNELTGKQLSTYIPTMGRVEKVQDEVGTDSLVLNLDE